MPGPSYQTPSRSTFPFGRIPIVDKNGMPTQDYARYMTALEAKTNQTLSVQGNTTLNNIVSATPTSLSPWVNVTGAIDMPEMVLTIITKGNPVLIIFSATVRNDTADRFTLCQLVINGVTQPQTVCDSTSSNVNAWVPAMINYLDIPSPGSNEYKIQWASSLGGAISTNAGLQRNLQAIELG